MLLLMQRGQVVRWNMTLWHFLLSQRHTRMVPQPPWPFFFSFWSMNTNSDCYDCWRQFYSWQINFHVKSSYIRVKVDLEQMISRARLPLPFFPLPHSSYFLCVNTNISVIYHFHVSGDFHRWLLGTTKVPIGHGSLDAGSSSAQMLAMRKMSWLYFWPTHRTVTLSGLLTKTLRMHFYSALVVYL